MWSGYQRRRLYGLTPERFAALIEAQNNVCAICKGSTDSFHVDHDHATDEIRGLLCGPCNRGLGMFRDEPAIIAAALDYLRRAK